MNTKIDKDAIGIEVSWSFGDGDAEAVTLPREYVRGVLTHHGFDATLIADVDAETALAQAAFVVKGRSRSIVVQEMRRPNKDTPRAFGVYQVQAKDESGDDVVCGARVRVDTGTDRVVCLAPDGGAPISECMSVGLELARISNSLIDNVINRDISTALVGIGWAGGWITRRRNSGGVYFMSAGERSERFIAVLHALEARTESAGRNRAFVPQVMEVYPKPLTMALWSGSAKDQYASDIDALAKDLAKMTADDKMRDSTVQKRADECDRLIAQAETHRLFLQEHVEVITAELARVRDEFRRKLSASVEAAKTAFDAADVLTAPATPKPKRAVKVAAPAPAPVKRVLSDEELFNV